MPRQIVIEGTDRADAIRGGNRGEMIIGYEGDDRLFGGGGNDFLVTDSAVIHYPDGVGTGERPGVDDDRDHAWGGAGDDVVHGSGGDDHLRGEDGRDSLWGFNGEDTLAGGRGDDVLYGDGAVSEPLFRSDDDELWGEAGNDELRGGRGADFLAGGPGRDRLWGDEPGWDEAGGDTFRVDVRQVYSGADTILDFEGEDAVLLWGGFAGKTTLGTRASGDGTDVLVDLDGAGRGHRPTLAVHLDDVRPSDLVLTRHEQDGMLTLG